MRKTLLCLSLITASGLFSVISAQTSGVLPPGTRPPSLRERHMQDNREYEVGVSFGNTYGLHDISGDPGRAIRLFIWDTQWELVNLHFGLFVRRRFSQAFSLQTALNYGKVSGSHVFYPPGTRQNDLGYSFQNHLVEWAWIPEVYLPRFGEDLMFDIYGFLGAAVFYHNPRVGSQGLVPVAERIRKIQPAIPMGMGFFYTSPSHLRIGARIGWRKTFTDYLDGYQSGQGMDSYFFLSLSMSYLFETWKNRPVRYD